MEILSIKSKTTLQKLRDTGAITFTQPQKKIILMNNTVSNKYIKGFNALYIIAEHKPSLMDSLLKSVMIL